MPDDSSLPTAVPFVTRYGFSRTGDSESPLSVDPYPEVCVGGALRATVVASAIDLVGGLATREIAGTDATFTSDLSLRIPRPGIPSRLLARGERLRAGRRLVSTGVTLEADEGTDHARLYAYGQTTFSRMTRQGPDAPDIASLSIPPTIDKNPLDRPLEEEVGLEVVDPTSGAVRVPLGPALLNPEGVMQGALVALVAECSALALANDAMPEEQVVTELDLRYLAAAAVGPVTARACWIGASADRMIRVELRDAGRENRLTTAALLRVTHALPTDLDPE